jgi:lipopolysaccharide transport system permease protein
MLNPLAGLIEGFRWSILRSDQIHWGYVGYSAVVSGLALFIGALAFKRMERKFADVI